MPAKTKTFRLSYAGEAEYDVDGVLYAVRYFANPRMPYAEGVLEKFIRPAVGTVRHYESSKFHDFPPREVVELFPGFVGARWNPETWQLEYDGAKPVLVPGRLVPYYVTSAGVIAAEEREAASA